RVPVDVEESRRHRARAVLEHVAPPGVRAGRDAHVVRHEVNEMRQAMLRKRPAEAAVGLNATSFVADLVVIADVVAMRAAWGGAEDGRRVARRDTQPREVRRDIRGRVEREVLVYLQPVRG